MKSLHSCAAFAQQQERWLAGDGAPLMLPVEPPCPDCEHLAMIDTRLHRLLEEWQAPAPGVAEARAALAEALARAREVVYYDTLDSPVGPILLAASERGLRTIQYLRDRPPSFELPLDLRDVGAFGERVLRAAAAIPFGQVRSYAELARAINAPRAARAVGAALGRNPLPIVIPCHRILRSDGSLGGYAYGPEVKQRLLALEGTLSAS
jgi:methylated-DNA-[protein]-cysteine S-methyltransferase